MHKTISDHSKRIRQQYESSLLAGIHPEKPQRRGGESDRIELENSKFREKIGKMKSVYKQTRKNSDLSLPPHLQEREKSRQTEKEKLVKLLKNQFKMEPIVSFPRSKAKTNNNDP
jgi:regulator of replication initiation timing